MKFITFVLALGALSLQGAQKPNILFIFTDDHAYQAVGAYDSWLKEHCPTPNIDSLARDGMLFEQCYVTNSICGPMRAAIQTGKYSHANGFLVNGNKFDGTQQTSPSFSKRQATPPRWWVSGILVRTCPRKDTTTRKFSSDRVPTTTRRCVWMRMATASTMR